MNTLVTITRWTDSEELTRFETTWDLAKTNKALSELGRAESGSIGFPLKDGEIVRIPQEVFRQCITVVRLLDE